MERDNKGRFVKGTNGNNYEGFGVWYDKKGYPTIWISNKNIKLHIYVWEKVNGERPKGFDIHHIDFNKRNYDIRNLELLTNSDHKRIHAGWLRENGKWTKKPCKDCKKLLPLDNFYQRKGLTPIHYCIKCSKVRFKKRSTVNYKFMRKKYMKKYYQKNKEKWKN